MAKRDANSRATPGAPRIVPATAEAILEAAGLIRAGALVAFPTETVYGLGADATNDRAVARIFAAKDRPEFNPLIVHVPSLDRARALVRFDTRAEKVAGDFWPGPLTLVLPRAAGCPVSLLASAGLATLAVRVPGHPVAHALLNAAACPVAAPSANRSGTLSPTEARHVAASLGDKVALILDGGRCPVGIESTVLDLSGETAAILRRGGVAGEDIAALIGPVAYAEGEGSTVRAPGMLASHYAPSLPMRLGCESPRPGEALLAFGPEVPPGFVTVLNLSEAGDLTEAAANLFAMLRALDRPEHTGIAATPVPETGLGRAINDRLRRAAAARG